MIIDNGQAYGALTDSEQKPVMPDKPWTDELAVKISVRDFSSAESYRTSNLDYRFATADQLYLGWGMQKFWEGTRVPRANIPNYTIFEQTESILPKIVGAIFADYPNWFQTDPRAGTSQADARNVANFIIGQMENLPTLHQPSVREVFRRCFKSGLIYGNGIAEMYYSRLEEKRVFTYRKFNAEKKTIVHPQLGVLEIPTGRVQAEIKRIPYTEKISQPFVRHIDIRDFYIDPNCPSHAISDARFVATRRSMTVDEISAYRGVKDFNVPSDEDLVQMSSQRPNAQGDFTKSQTDLFRQMWWSPQIDTTEDPAGKRIEVIEYTTRNRKVWVLNRVHPMYNQPNEYGFINYYDFFYCDVPGRFYGLAISDVCEGEQRLQKAIIDARIDELALCLNKPMIKKKGLAIPAYQLKVRPGQVTEAENPREDIIEGKVNDITQQSYIEVQASGTRVQQITGGSDLAILGTPSTGGNSANRTATGVGAQVQAVGSRVQYQVENAEDTVIEQFLSDWFLMDQKFTDPNAMVTLDGKPVDPLQIINADVKFSMRASAKMQASGRLMQIWPLIFQSLTNPAFLQQLAGMGRAINWEEVESMLLDMTAYRNRAGLFRELSPQEQQSMNQPPPEEVIRMKMQSDRIAGQKDMSEDKQLNELVRTLLKGILDHGKAEHGDLRGAMTQLQSMVTAKLMDHASNMAQLETEQENAPTEPSTVQ